jgi:AraC-like DNA-binding protein
MNYARISPEIGLEKIIECYWFADSDDKLPRTEKIIPDGFPEIIFHFGDAYQINLHGTWQLQSKNLLAGQIKKYFYLQNTGASGMVGVKLKPSAVAQLYNVDMAALTDQVVNLNEILGNEFSAIDTAILNKLPQQEILEMLNTYFREMLNRVFENKIELALIRIFDTQGNVQVREIADELSITERHLERLFKKFVGVSPKFYARIIRFSHIFNLMQQGDKSWLDVALSSGFYDQSHFIRNFKAFSGEDPSAYLFDEVSFANFFMKKTVQGS